MNNIDNKRWSLDISWVVKQYWLVFGGPLGLKANNNDLREIDLESVLSTTLTLQVNLA